MESIITSTELIPTSISTNVDSDTEQELTNAIIELWSTHAQVKSNIKKTKADLKAIRTDLAERLFTMKALLAKPGRGGQWSSFLTEHNISRTSADRLCAFHEKSLNPDGNSTSGAITDEEIAKLAESVWAKLERRLKGHSEKYLFFSRLIMESSTKSEEYEDGILLINPMYEPGPEPSVPENIQLVEAL
jgi:hypothetical protein